jgi:hypothetical protein
MLPKDIFLQCYLSRSHSLQNSCGLRSLIFTKIFLPFSTICESRNLQKCGIFLSMQLCTFLSSQSFRCCKSPHYLTQKRKKASEKKPLAYAAKLFFFFFFYRMYIDNLCSSALVSLSRGWGWKRLDLASNFSTLSRQLESWKLIISRLVKEKSLW